MKGFLEVTYQQIHATPSIFQYGHFLQWGYPPKSSTSIGFFIIKLIGHPCWGSISKKKNMKSPHIFLMSFFFLSPSKWLIIYGNRILFPGQGLWFLQSGPDSSDSFEVHLWWNLVVKPGGFMVKWYVVLLHDLHVRGYGMLWLFEKDIMFKSCTS